MDFEIYVRVMIWIFLSMSFCNIFIERHINKRIESLETEKEILKIKLNSLETRLEMLANHITDGANND